MSDERKSVAVADRWSALRAHTAARIALGHAGHALPTAAHLDFQAGHAMARDAVHTPLDWDRLEAAIRALGIEALRVESAAGDRARYLARPDLGRRLSTASAERLSEPAVAPDVLILVGDGLASRAAEENAAPLLAALLPGLAARGLRVHPVLLAAQARVALGDNAGEILQARLCITLIGERPGLSAANSLGVYITYGPRVGRVDAERNCISNVRQGGLTPAQAAGQTLALVDAMLRHAVSGVALPSPGG